MAGGRSAASIRCGRSATSKRFWTLVGYRLRMLEFLPDDPVIIAIVLILLSLIFFTYLLLRRTILEFRDGMRGGR
ncbi:hypothetical protein AArc1_3487 [Natrarchaeobaculum sulfurireducens]|uniref:Uncharacterized protein n=1 Tax=Natrarchaeobaculum sulfurireducens TaxID=2044521 RepID=A0A346PJT4_9EURY|nr:hypothetical protein AArc1_3487 [Natrarchaeobaculum sulfurireducens]